MIYVFYELVAENKGRVTTRHFRPDMLSAASKAVGLEIDPATIPPDPEPVAGKAAVLYVNPTTKEFWYEYVDRPETLEEKTERLDRALQTIILDVLSGGES